MWYFFKLSFGNSTIRVLMMCKYYRFCKYCLYVCDHTYQLLQSVDGCNSMNETCMFNCVNETQEKITLKHKNIIYKSASRTSTNSISIIL